MQNGLTDSTTNPAKFPHGTRVYLRGRRHDKPGEVTGGPTDDGIYVVHWDDQPHAACVHEHDLVADEQTLTESLSA